MWGRLPLDDPPCGSSVAMIGANSFLRRNGYGGASTPFSHLFWSTNHLDNLTGKRVVAFRIVIGTWRFTVQSNVSTFIAGETKRFCLRDSSVSDFHSIHKKGACSTRSGLGFVHRKFIAHGVPAGFQSGCRCLAGSRGSNAARAYRENGLSVLKQGFSPRTSNASPF